MRDDKKYPVIVVGAGDPCLGVIRSLAPRGINPWACDPHRAIATRSRYTRYWHVPDPNTDEWSFIRRVVELARTIGGRPIIIPAADRYAHTIARYQDRLEECATVCVAASHVVDLLIDKTRFHEWCMQHSLSCPKTKIATQVGATHPADFPFVAKYSRSPPTGEYQRNQFNFRFSLIRNERDWDEYRHEFADYLPDILVQEFVHGTTADMFGVGIYADRKSEIKGVFVGRKIRGYPAMFGDSSAVQNDTVPDSVLSEVALVIRELRYTGIAEFEFKRDVRTGDYRLIEVNPRCWGWIGITSASPANIPWIAYRDLTGRRVETAIDNGKPGSIKYVHLVRDLPNAVHRYRWDHPGWLMSPAQWWKTLRAEKLLFDEIAPGDWLLALWFFVRCVRSVGRGLFGWSSFRLTRLFARFE